MNSTQTSVLSFYCSHTHTHTAWSFCLNKRPSKQFPENGSELRIRAVQEHHSSTESRTRAEFSSYSPVLRQTLVTPGSSEPEQTPYRQEAETQKGLTFHEQVLPAGSHKSQTHTRKLNIYRQFKNVKLTSSVKSALKMQGHVLKLISGYRAANIKRLQI